MLKWYSTFLVNLIFLHEWKNNGKKNYAKIKGNMDDY